MSTPERRDILFVAIVCGIFGILCLAASCGVMNVEAQMRSLHPRLTPAEAAEVLRRSPGLANVANQPSAPLPTGPTFVILGSGQPQDGAWAWPAPLPARRLDGTPLAQPPAVYGGAWLGRPWGGYRHPGPSSLPALADRPGPVSK